MCKAIDKSNLVLVEVNVNGEHGQYRAKRWKSPASALTEMKNGLKDRGITEKTKLIFTDKKGSISNEQELLNKYKNIGRGRTLQQFIKEEYKSMDEERVGSDKSKEQEESKDDKVTFKNKDEIRNILDMEISDDEKKEKIAKIRNVTADIGRVIWADELLDFTEGQIVEGLGRSWSDRDDENMESFVAENDYGDVEYIFHLKSDSVQGYKLQYFNYDDVFDYLYNELDMEEDKADELATEISEDETYIELMELLGSDGDMRSEAEILVPNSQKFKVDEILDGREDEGYITIILEPIKDEEINKSMFAKSVIRLNSKNGLFKAYKLNKLIKVKKN